MRETFLGMVANLADHILRHAIGRAKDIAEFVLLQDRVVGPRCWLSGESFFENLVTLRCEVPIEVVDLLAGDWRLFHVGLYYFPKDPESQTLH